MQEIEGVVGVHVMAYRQEELVAEIIREAGLLPRPRLKVQSISRSFEGELEMLRRQALVEE